MVKLGLYKHYKGGEYRVTGYCELRHKKLKEKAVIYYDINEPKKIYVRTITEFNEYHTKKEKKYRKLTRVCRSCGMVFEPIQDFQSKCNICLNENRNIIKPVSDNVTVNREEINISEMKEFIKNNFMKPSKE